MSPAAISALSALAGSAIGALATLATTWFTLQHQAERERVQQDGRRREQLYGEFVGMAAQLYIEALSHEFEAEKVVPLYALISRMRLFAPIATMTSADAVMTTIVHAYMAPNYRFGLVDEAAREKLDLLREFTEICRADLAR